MTGREAKSSYVFRYFYLMMAAVMIVAAAVIVGLFFTREVVREAQERANLYNLGSAALATDFGRENQSILDLLDRPAAFSGTGTDAGDAIRSGPDARGILSMLSTILTQLQELQNRYQDPQFVATLDRIAKRLEVVSAAVNEGREEAARDAISGLDLAIRQFYRQHLVAADEAYAKTESAATRALSLLGAVVILVAAAFLVTWTVTRRLRSSMARQEAAEAALAESRDRMHRMQKLEALGLLVGGVAHEFNNLLTAILGQAELMLGKSGGDERLSGGLTEIRRAGQQAAALTRQLLAFSRPQPLDTRVVDLGDLIGEFEGMVRTMIGEDIQLTVECADDLDPVELDPGQMQQVILNLAMNARDAMPEGGQLRITTANRESGRRCVVLTVADSGVGMDEATLSRAFEPFFTTKPMGRGTGLGLSTVHGIITAAKGRIRIDSRPGSGTNVEIELPSSPRPADAITLVPPPLEAVGGSETVLVVEDEDQIRAFLKQGLGGLGYRVLTAADAKSGLEQCRAEHLMIDVIVCDVVMPGVNGVEFLEQARRLQPRAAAILMSGYADDVIQSNSAGEMDVPLVRKPFELFTLARLIRERLEQS